MKLIARFASRLLYVPGALLLVLLLFGLAGPLPGTALGQGPFTIEDGNSVVHMHTGQQATAFDWLIGGTDHLRELSNWYRVGPGDPGGPPGPGNGEASLHTLSILSETLIDSDGSGEFETLKVLYDNPGLFTLEMTYSVKDGPAGGMGSLGECFRVFNTSGADLELHLFEYMDLDVNNTQLDDTVMLTGPGSLQQFDGTSKFFFSYFPPSHHELGFFSTTRTHLGNNSTSILNDFPGGPFTPVTGGNVTWAIQWDLNLSAGGSAEICKIGRCRPANWIPEPASGGLAVGAAMALAVGLRRQRSGRGPTA